MVVFAPKTKKQAIAVPFVVGLGLTVLYVVAGTLLGDLGFPVLGFFLLASLSVFVFLGSVRHIHGVYVDFLQREGGDKRAARIHTVGYSIFETLVLGALFTGGLYLASFLSGAEILHSFWEVFFASCVIMAVYDCVTGFSSWVSQFPSSVKG